MIAPSHAGRRAPAPVTAQTPRRAPPIGAALVAAALTAAVLGGHGGAQAKEAPQPERYRACLDLADKEPDKAYDQATHWIDDRGGVPARHCQAMALMGLGQFEAAGEKLRALAEAPGDMPKSVRAELWVQTGEVYLLGKYPDDAVRALDQAIRLAPEDVGIRLDKARALALKPEWALMRTELDMALRLDPTSIDGWALRATARRMTGQIAAAEEDVDTALALDETRGDIWLERGLIDQAKGDKPAARRNLVRAITLDEKSPVAEKARFALEAMDFKADGLRPGGASAPAKGK